MSVKRDKGVAGAAAPTTAEASLPRGRITTTPPADPPGSPESVVIGPVVLLGVPGAGKGTQAKRIVTRYGVPHISTGDMFRELIHSDGALGQRIRSLVESGDLVPDDVVCEMVAERLTRADCKRGFVLDGFPRTPPQTAWLNDYLPRIGWKRGVVVIYLGVGYNDLYRRLAGRRSCPVCGRIYNDFTQPPREAGVCDVDGSRLVQRKDDDPDVIRERLTAYEEQTLPLVEYYRQHGRFYQIRGTDPVEKITARIFGVLEGRDSKNDRA